MKKQEVQRRDDTPRTGAQRYTIILEKQYVNFLKAYALKNKLRITDIVNDLFKEFKKRKG